LDLAKRIIMARIQRFTEMPLWNQARKLAREVYRITSSGAFSRDWALRDQIRKAAISIPSNIAEGFERGGSAEFIQFLSVAKGSNGEVLAQLILSRDMEYLSLEEFVRMEKTIDETGRMIGGLIKYLRRSGVRGAKYR